MTTMNHEDFIKGALQTESNDFEAIKGRMTDDQIRLLHAAIGMATESGEFIDMLKKHLFYGKPLDEVNLFEEIGDIMWYVAIALDVLGKSFEECFYVNNDKLTKKRYKNGFTEKDAVQRDLETERAALEEGFNKK